VNRQLWVWVVLAGCSSSPKQSPQLDAGAEPDAAVIADAADPPIDAMPDALVVPGAACPSTPVEVARIPNAANADTFTFLATLHGDIDHAGGEDVVVVDYDFRASGTPVRLRAFLRTPTGFAAPVTSQFSFPSTRADRIVLGDVNGDHLTDVVLTNTTNFPRKSSVYVAVQQADHTFVLGPARDLSACNFSMDERLEAFAVVDTDRDGIDDVIATLSYAGLGGAPEGVSRLAGSASGLGGAVCVASASIKAGFPDLMIGADRFLVEDFDGDGHADVAGLYLGRYDAQRGQIVDQAFVFPSTGASQFRVAPMSVEYVTGNQFVVDHVAGRARQHLARLRLDTSTGNSTRLRIDDTGIVATELIATYPTGSNGNITAFPFAVGDFNHDGLTDVVEAVPGAQRFDIACDRAIRWDSTYATFPVPVYDLKKFDFTADGRQVVMVQSTTDLVFYRLD
jgi:hypothetical protein